MTTNKSTKKRKNKGKSVDNDRSESSGTNLTESVEDLRGDNDSLGPSSGSKSRENLLNLIKDDNNDSSDSEREFEASDEELEQFEDVPSEAESFETDTEDEPETENEELTDSESEESATNEPEVKKPDEYEVDTSDEEDIRNTTGNVPKNWYDDFKHIGYDQLGERILKPESGDQLDEFLRKVDDPDFWRTVIDPQTGQEVILGEEELELIRRIQGQKVPDQQFDEYAPWIEWFTSEVMQTPVRKFPEHKRSFLPSRAEAKKVSRLVHALNMGWIKTRAEAAKERQKPKEPQFYMLWQTDDSAEDMRRIHKHIAAPKRHLPGHAESYNPPPEYLFDAKEMKEWNKLKDAPWKRKLHFVPQKFGSLREVPSYSKYIRERFLRCLDLYLCPRAIKMRLNIEPESLVPKLPSPRDLQPFPSALMVEYLGHQDMVRSISCDPRGQYLASGSDDETVKIWEINTGRCLKTFPMGDVVRCVSWCPNTALALIAVGAGNHIYLINPGVGDQLVVSKTDSILQEPLEEDVVVSERVRSVVQWREVPPSEALWLSGGVRVHMEHFRPVQGVSWHPRGDYLSAVLQEAQARSVVVHQLSRRRSQLPFAKNKGLVQCAAFHPTRPYLFVATQRNIRIYDLVKQDLVKKLLSNSRWISCMAVHPGGDNLLVGTYDRKMLWFDLDLSTKPYQTLRLHGTAVRGVAFHPRYPLFASGSDDRSLIVCHGMVYNDLLQNPLIVPLKRLKDHEQFNDFGIFDVKFHPSQPWVFSSGADGTIKLYS